MNNTLNTYRNQRWQLVFFALVAAIIFMLGYNQNHRFDGIREVSVNEAKALIDSGALVIDVREEDKYHSRHIPGALSIPLAILRMGIPGSLSHAMDKPIVVYCGDGVTTGPEGTQLLNQAGFTQAVNVKAGIGGWADAGLPVQK